LVEAVNVPVLVTVMVAARDPSALVFSALISPRRLGR
jgi:hypothetical protein